MYAVTDDVSTPVQASTILADIVNTVPSSPVTGFTSILDTIGGSVSVNLSTVVNKDSAFAHPSIALSRRVFIPISRDTVSIKNPIVSSVRVSIWVSLDPPVIVKVASVIRWGSLTLPVTSIMSVVTC